MKRPAGDSTMILHYKIHFRNILYSPSHVDSVFTGTTFTGIRYAVAMCAAESDSVKRQLLRQQADKQVSIATLCVMTATNILQDSIIT